MFSNYIDRVNQILSDIDEKLVKSIINRLLECKGNVYFVGNGASASMASHFSVDLMKNGKIRTQCFHDPAFLTCYGNDYGFENIFSTKLEEIATRDDILFAISSSGNSQNIINAVLSAKKIGMFIIGFSGFSRKNLLNKLSDISLYVDGHTFGEVEITHNVVLHYFMDIVEEERKVFTLKNNIPVLNSLERY